ncbi:MAG: response regulator [Anaerolineae bacterium]|nr:response regulator [Anaerolineae bacterium]
MNGSDNLKKVLIVDDEDMTRVLLTHILNRMHVDGLEILLAEDGEEAVRIAQDERPGLILLDVLLPKMNGYDVCQRVRLISGYNPYIVILTARGNSNDRQRAEAIGANDFMTKPFNPARLMNQLSEIWGL